MTKQKLFDAVRTQVESLLERGDLRTRDREHLSRALSELNGLYPRIEDLDARHEMYLGETTWVFRQTCQCSQCRYAYRQIQAAQLAVRTT